MMKKTLFLTALAVCAVSLSAQEVAGGGASTMDVSKYRNVGLLNTNVYAQSFIPSVGSCSPAALRRYEFVTSTKNW